MVAKPLSVLTLAVVLACATSLGACSADSEAQLLASAQASLARNDTKAAIIQLKGALQQNPESGAARYLLGKALLESGDAAAALVELRKSQSLQYDPNKVVPELARAMLVGGETDKLAAQFGGVKLTDAQAAADLQTTLATAYAARQEFDSARAAIAEAERLAPDHVPAKILLAQLDALGGDLNAAFKGLDAVLAAHPKDAAAAVLKANLLLQARNDRSGALAIYQQVLKAQPDWVPAHIGTLEVLFRENRIKDVGPALAALKKVAPNQPETLFYDARLAFAEGRYKEVADLSDRLLKALPNNLRVLELAGAAEFRQRRFLQAEALLTRALAVAPRQLLTRQMLAQTHLQSGQPDKAIQVLGPVVAQPAADGTSLALAGEAYLQMGDTERSEAAYQRALKAAPADTGVRTSAALAQLATGHESEAITELQSIVASGGGTHAELALISGLLRKNDVPGALKAIDALQQKAPDEPLADNLRGRVLLAQGDTAGARRNFEAALKKSPHYFPAVASLAAIEIQEGKPDLAQQRFDALLKAQPQEWRALLAQAELSARAGAAPAQVLDLMRRATRTDPTAPTPRLVLINRLLGSGDPKAALVAAQEANAAVPNNFEILDALGRAQIAAGDGQRAISTFKDLAAQQPSQVQHELRLADAYLANKDPEGAAAALQRALRVQPGLFAAKRGLVLLALLDKRPQDALVIAREMQKTQPKNAAGYALEGDIEVSRKNWDAAAAAFRQATQRTAQPEAAQRLHSALVSGGKPAEAERVAADWLKAHPNDVSFRFYLGDMASVKGALAQSEAHYRGVLAVQPRNALALNNIAWLMVQQGKPGAVALARQAAELLPNQASLQDTLSVALEAERQMAPAVEAQRRAVALNPGDPKLSLRLARLYLKQGDKDRARAELEALSKRNDGSADQAEVSALLKTL